MSNAHRVCFAVSPCAPFVGKAIVAVFGEQHTLLSRPGIGRPINTSLSAHHKVCAGNARRFSFIPVLKRGGSTERGGSISCLPGRERIPVVPRRKQFRQQRFP